jgi:CRP-like cAMP-binding protein
VVLQARTPTSDVMLDATGAGDVIGWSWLVPPYRWTFDARSTEDSSVVAFDGACLREKCHNDAAVGYELLTKVVQVMATRLQSARVRLIDMYGNPG